MKRTKAFFALMIYISFLNAQSVESIAVLDFDGRGISSMANELVGVLTQIAGQKRSSQVVDPTQEITATGYGAVPANAPNVGAARAIAIRAAKLDALRNLLETVKGVRIDDHTTVGEKIKGNNVLIARVQGMVRGARQTGDVKYTSNSTVGVTMAIRMGGLISIFPSIADQSPGVVAYTPSVPKPATSTRPISRKKPTAKADRTPPTIRITAPSIARGMKKIQQEKMVQVRGQATDESGIFEILVNGQEASLDADGSFWAEVKLRVGENRIAVKATDMKDNSASTAFTVVRETGAKAPPVVVVAKTKEPDLDFGEYHALFIAVEDYADRSITDLDFPVKDAESFRKVLHEEYRFEPQNITFLKNPSRKEIFSELRSLKKLGKNDNLLIFYAGHGYWDEDAKQGYWLPSNASRDDESEWISNSDIKDRIRSIKSRHTLLISDACFAGGIFKTRTAFSDASVSIQKIYEMPSRKAITSGNLKEVPDQSVFIEYLVKRLKGNQEPYLYSEKLYVSLKEGVTNNSANHQTPLFGVIQGAGDDGGDFIFVRRR